LGSGFRQIPDLSCSTTAREHPDAEGDARGAALSQEHYQSPGRYTVAHLSGYLKKVEGSLVSGSFWEYFIPPVVIPALIVVAVVVIAVFRWW
jgi:hypothetical protein